MSVVVVGLNHRTVPLELLERVNVSPTRLPKVLGDLAAREHVGEVVVLSTCHRTEVYAVAERYHGAVQDIRNAFSEMAFIAPEDFSDHLYTYFDEGAVNHLFSVAAGVDSVVLGESEILGQVRNAWQRAQEEGSTGPRLAALFRQALVVGKRARTETAIGRGSTSLAHAAVDMAERRLGSLEGKRILLLGAGEVGESMALAVAGIDGAEVFVANRTWERAVALASRVGGRAVQLDGVREALADVDLLLTSTGAPSAIVDQTDLAPVVEARGGRPLLIVDVAMPRDIDPSVSELPGVELLDLDDVRAFVEAGLAERRREVDRVRAIIDEERERFLESVTAREVAPTITALRERAEALRVAELERHRGRLEGLDAKQREAVEAVTRGVLAKLLHDPTVHLKDAAGTPKGERLSDALRELFDL
ncbi:MAG: glutamyl-tRNA reductase [Acidimicrobiia bacterium]|nr:glutamyl-tRNA reductase [Acidimicrobiia bacterium]MBV8986569.1 glutamyl-tRNA reductase [Acidimicrobiia bacterium]MBV9042511.1 glutamyl-tRNA reductase [Acidimicrobiia bacterium]